MSQNVMINILVNGETGEARLVSLAKAADHTGDALEGMGRKGVEAATGVDKVEGSVRSAATSVKDLAKESDKAMAAMVADMAKAERATQILERALNSTARAGKIGISGGVPGSTSELMGLASQVPLMQRQLEAVKMYQFAWGDAVKENMAKDRMAEVARGEGHLRDIERARSYQLAWGDAVKKNMQLDKEAASARDRQLKQAASSAGLGAFGTEATNAGNALNHFHRHAKLSADSVTSMGDVMRLVKGDLEAFSFNVWKVAMNVTLWGGLFTGAAAGVEKLIEQGAKYNALSQGFDAMASSQGHLTTTIVEGTKKSTMGLIGEMDIMKNYNAAVALRVNVSEAQFATLSGAAVKMSRIMGVDVNHALDSLITGLGRQSIRILDNIGVIMKAKEAYRAFADQNHRNVNSLTDDEKRVAFFNMAIQRLEENAKKSGESVLTLGEAFTQAKVALTDTIAKTMAYVVTGSAAQAEAQGITGAMKQVTDAIWANRDAIRDLLLQAVTFGKQVFELVASVTQWVVANHDLLESLLALFVIAKLTSMTINWGTAIASLAANLGTASLSSTNFVTAIVAAGLAVNVFIRSLADLSDLARRAESGMLTYDWWDTWSEKLVLLDMQVRRVTIATLRNMEVMANPAGALLGSKGYWGKQLEDLDANIAKQKEYIEQFRITSEKNKALLAKPMDWFKGDELTVTPEAPSKSAGGASSKKTVEEWLGWPDPADVAARASAYKTLLAKFSDDVLGQQTVINKYADDIKKDFEKVFGKPENAVSTELMTKMLRDRGYAIADISAQYKDLAIVEELHKLEQKRLKEVEEARNLVLQDQADQLLATQRAQSRAAQETERTMAATDAAWKTLFKRDVSPAQQMRMDFEQYTEALRRNQAAWENSRGLLAEGTPDWVLAGQAIEATKNSLDGVQNSIQGFIAGLAQTSPILAEFVAGVADTLPTLAEQVFDLGKTIQTSLIDGFGEAVSSVVMGSQTMGQAFKNLGKQLLASIVGALAKMAATWLLTLIFGKKTQETALGNAQANVAEAYPKMISSASAIPYVGWAIGVAAAEAMSARVQGLIGAAAGGGGGLGSIADMTMPEIPIGHAKGLWEVPGGVTQPFATVAHGKEAILTYPDAKAFRTLVSRLESGDTKTTAPIVGGAIGGVLLSQSRSEGTVMPYPDAQALRALGGRAEAGEGHTFNVPIAVYTDMLVTDDDSARARAAEKLSNHIAENLQRKVKRGELAFDTLNVRG